jgi:hypothetical protein
MKHHYYAANSLCYSKANNAANAVALLEVTHFPNQPEKEMPVSIIKVMVPIDKAYSISTFLPEGVEMIVEQQDYPSNLPIGERCLLEDGTLYFGKQ